MRLALRKGVALLAIATVAFVSSASALIDGIDPSASALHFEGPVGPPTELPGHNHSLCAMMGATPVLPGGAPATAVAAVNERSALLPLTKLAPAGVRITTCRSRAPPSL